MPRFFGQSDGIKFKQGVRRESCGVASTVTITIKPLDIGFSFKYFVKSPDVFIGVFEVEHTAEEVAVRIPELGHAARAAGEDGVSLVHDIDVVKALIASL